MNAKAANIRNFDFHGNSMTVYDLMGALIPIDHPKFKKDAQLKRKIRTIEGLVEIGHDAREAKEALIALRNSMRAENWKNITSLFQCAPWQISEAMLSFIASITLVREAHHR